MTATYELAAWFTVVGLILGAALASWWYEGDGRNDDDPSEPMPYTTRDRAELNRMLGGAR